jgi:hypothetical protein
MTDAQAATIAAILERLKAIEAKLEIEHGAGAERGRDQGTIRERVAVIEANHLHMVEAVKALTTRVNAAAVSGVGGAGAVIWALMQSGLLGAGQ